MFNILLRLLLQIQDFEFYLERMFAFSSKFSDIFKFPHFPSS